MLTLALQTALWLKLQQLVSMLLIVVCSDQFVNDGDSLLAITKENIDATHFRFWSFVTFDELDFVDLDPLNLCATRFTLRV